MLGNFSRKAYRCKTALRYHHGDEHAAEKSFIKGKSTSNHRIASYWRQFRQHMGDFYIDLFRQIEHEDIFYISNPMHTDCLCFCFGQLIKEEIELTREEWNEHRVHKQRNRNCLGGKPNELYDLPVNFGASDCRMPLDKQCY